MERNEGTLVAEHYGGGELTARVGAALRRAGLDREPITWSELAPLDQFHVRGLAATRELAAGLDLAPGSTLLDVGCGLGGPSRYLAAECGARVTGIDLTPSYLEVARMLTERCGLAGSVEYRLADALALPFADAFDFAWTQHVAMNIADRAGFYGSIHRVLKPGGRLAIYDIVAGDGTPLRFPVPWAREPEHSHLLTAGAMREVLGQSGFRIVSWTDQTAAGLAWAAKQEAALLQGGTVPELGIHVVMGPEFAGMAANLTRNLKEGRAGLVQTIVQAV